jgi:hypothetical protein
MAMSLAAAFALALALALALLSGPAGAAQAPQPISGKLSQPGYTVIALDENGKAVTDLAENGSFELTPPATEVTLHVRAADGTYAGPVVLEESGNPVKRAKKSLGKATRALRRAKARLKKVRTRARAAKGRVAAKQAKKKVKKAQGRLKRAKRTAKTAKKTLRRARKRAKGTKAILGVRAGAKLDRVTIDSAAGYATAKLTTRQWKRWVDEKRGARAENGVPIGAGNFGLVSTTPPRNPPAGDSDSDGVPDPLDVDDDGDLVLDDYDRSTATATGASPSRAATSQVGTTFPDGSHLSVNTTLDEDSSHAANADGLSTYEQIAASQAAQGQLEIFWYGIDPGSGELDCGQLIYCTLGGTGRYSPHPNTYEAFPECCDSDGNGFGALTQSEGFAFGGADAGAMRLFPGVGGNQIGTGDVLILHGTVNGTPVESVKTIGFAFATAPVIASYDDGQGDATTFTLPLPPDLPPAPVRAGPNGDIVLNLKVWRPQRIRTAGDPGSGDWTDMGNLQYMTKVFLPDAGPTQGVGCPQSTISTADPNLAPTATTPYGPYPDAGGFLDSFGDRSGDPANTFTYTVDLTSCLASQGITPAPGQEGYLGVLTVTNNQDAAHLALAVYSLHFQVQ